MSSTITKTIAGGEKDKVDTRQTSGVTLGKESSTEAYAKLLQSGSLKGLEGLVGAGAQESDVTAATGAARELAALFKQYQQSGGLPTDADITQGRSYADSLFAPQMQALEQSFQTQQRDAASYATSLGRDVNDPVIQAKLRTGFFQQQNALNAEKGAYGTQLAMALPGQRLGYAEANAGQLNNLATQAFQNRAALLSAGSGVLGSERSWRLQTAEKYGTGHQESGGGFKGMVQGYNEGKSQDLASIGQIMSMASGMPSSAGGGYGNQSPQYPGSTGGYNGANLGVNTSMPTPQYQPAYGFGGVQTQYTFNAPTFGQSAPGYSGYGGKTYKLSGG